MEVSRPRISAKPCLDLPDHRVKQDRLDHRANKVQQAQPVILDRKALRDHVASRDRKAPKDQQVKPDRKAPRDQQGSRERQPRRPS